MVSQYMGYRTLKSIIIVHQNQCAVRKKKEIWELQHECMSAKPFKIINRSSEYLQWHMVNFFKKNKLEFSDSAAQPVERQRTPSRKKSVVTKRRVARQPRKNSLIGSQFNGFFRWPLKKTQFWLSSFFGPRKKPNRSWGFHYGVDMAALKGTVVYAAAGGRVIYAAYQKGYGNTVLIEHNKHYTTRYAHLDSIWTSTGKLVPAGGTIGTVGDTGYTRKNGRDASHLHFEISDRGKQVNPLPLLPAL
jgi:murein DD-endopeptidase MepM/ murein hydrolase activator NlpD